MQEGASAQRCLDLVAQLNVEQGWNLSPQECQRYAQCAIVSCAGFGNLSDGALRRALWYYHKDHALVEALRDPGHPEHTARWAEWTRNALQVLAFRWREQFGMDEAVVSMEDLAQEAMHDLWRGLISFRYQSRFHTWAFTVIGNAFMRRCRGLRAHKRKGLAEAQSLDALLIGGATLHDRSTPSPEDVALGAALAELSRALLEKHPDKRLMEIFQLWASEEQTLRAIGERFNLSVGRVHGLLAQAVALLRDERDLQEWDERDCADPAQEHGTNAGDFIVTIM